MRLVRALVLAGLIGAAVPAHAADTPSVLEFSAGIFDLAEDGAAGAAGVEWRGQPALWWFRPMVGAKVTSDAAAYGYAGLALELWWANNRIVLTPSAAVGAYHKGDGKDLGHTIEFRTGASLQYRFDNERRLGLAFHHLSNAGIGRRNPGEESLMLTYTAPLDGAFSFFGR